jgi:hypothetical protein
MDVMFRENWLLSYVEGIDKILTQMDRRTKTSPKHLQQKNFKNFILNLKSLPSFQDLQEHVRKQLISIHAKRPKLNCCFT